VQAGESILISFVDVNTLDQALGLVKVSSLAGVPEVIGGHLVEDVFVLLE